MSEHSEDRAVFEDLTIVGHDEERTHNPDPSRKLYHVYLRLSGTAPPEWAEFFDQARRFPRHSMWRHAWCEGDAVVVHCPIDEVATHHLADLKQDVATANSQYRDFLRRSARESQQAADAAAKEQARVRDALGRLKF